MLIVDCLDHAIIGLVASEGPTPDIDQLDRVLAEVPAGVRIRHMVLDAGFDSAHNHRLLREDNGILSTIPPLHGRPPKDPNAMPRDRYRRRMKTHFNHRAYRHRPAAETVFSMLKRNLGSALRGRSYHSRRRDLMLRALTHNIALVLLWVFYRALPTPLSSRFSFFRVEMKYWQGKHENNNPVARSERKLPEIPISVRNHIATLGNSHDPCVVMPV